MPLTILADIKAKPGRADDLKAALEALIPTTRAEEGCETYELHRSIEDDDWLHFHERWTSMPLWEAHMGAPHLKAFGEKTDELVAEWSLRKLEPIA